MAEQRFQEVMLRLRKQQQLPKEYRMGRISHRGLVTKLIAAERVDTLWERRPLLQAAGM